MTALECLEGIMLEHKEGHPVRVACIRAIYDIKCLESLKTDTINEIGRFCCSSADMKPERYRKLSEEVLMFDRMIQQTLADIKDLAAKYDWRKW